MALAILSVIAFLALIVWRFVFNGQQPQASGQGNRRTPAARQQLFRAGPQILEPAGVEIVGDDRFEHASEGVGLADRKDRAKTYLRRIVALTGGTQMGSGYELDVGTTRFQVRGSYVRRLRDVNNPKCAYEETCFYSEDQSMPKAEQIATALLQLKNNPALFDKWADHCGLAFKADGQVFTRAQ